MRTPHAMNASQINVRLVCVRVRVCVCVCVSRLPSVGAPGEAAPGSQARAVQCQ